jgi:hypothetical protein
MILIYSGFGSFRVLVYTGFWFILRFGLYRIPGLFSSLVLNKPGILYKPESSINQTLNKPESCLNQTPE